MSAPLPEASLRETRRRLAAALGRAGVETAELDARLLICHALSLDDARYYADPQRLLAAAELSRIDELLARRLAGEPVSRIIGRRGFWKHEFALSAETLDPRPDSETLIETALALIDAGGRRKAALRLLDLGTGSGALIISLLLELPRASGIGVDLGEGALLVAADNAQRLGCAARVRFQRGDWLEGFDERFDLIVCNPPYIPRGEIDGLAVEVARFDPRRALDGGVDGIDPYRVILPQLHRFLAPGALALFEFGAGQHETIAELARQSGLLPAGGGDGLYSDLAGRWRCLAVTNASGQSGHAC